MKAFIIHLSKIQSSHKSALEVKDSLKKIANIDASLFEGSYGNTTKEKFIQNNKLRHPWGIKGPKRPYVKLSRDLEHVKPGEIGCFESHFRLWQKCIDLKQPIMIFEDDVIIFRPYIPVEFDDVLSIAFSHEKKMRKYIDYLEAPEGTPSAVMYKQGSMPGLGGYIIKPHAAKQLTQEYADTFLPADNAVNQHVVKIQIHNYMIGRAKRKNEGNISTIRRTDIWKKI